MRTAIGFLALVGAALMAPLVVQPSAHDFGKVVVRGSSGQSFKISVPKGVTPGDTISATITGNDAQHFEIQSGSCTGWATGSCTYEVDFRPINPGSKTATLVVTDSRGNRGTATLRGEGVEVIECKAELVPCNYAWAYEGTIMVVEVDSTIIGRPLGKTLLWRRTTEIRVDEDQVTCYGKDYNFGQTWADGGTRLTGQVTGNGVIDGTGYVAVEFERSDGVLQYRVSFACPTPRMTVQTENFIEGYEPIKTEVYEAEAADPDDLVLACVQPAKAVAQDSLKADHIDVRPDMGDDVGGAYVTTCDLRLQRF